MLHNADGISRIRDARKRRVKEKEAEEEKERDTGSKSEAKGRRGLCKIISERVIAFDILTACVPVLGTHSGKNASMRKNTSEVRASKCRSISIG